MTFTATVAAVPPGAGTPTGTVDFFDGRTTIGTGTLTAGVATLGTNALAVRTHSITAFYAGDTNFATNASPVLSQVVISPFVVTNTKDSGLGSLRFAIQAANADVANDDIITFKIPTTDPRYDGPTGSWTIPVGAGLTIAKPSSGGVQHTVFIDGLSQQLQPGAATTHPVIVITPVTSFLGDGLTLNSGGNTVQGLVIDGFQGAGLVLNSGSDNNLVVGNFVGTDPTGTVGRGNTLDGILLNDALSNRIIGNVVSGNGLGQNAAGINLESNDSNNTIAGNMIGTDTNGSTELGNSQAGIEVRDGSNSNILGPDNVISGNGTAGNNGIGVYIFSDNPSGKDNPSGNVLQGNYIGTNSDGSSAITSHGSSPITRSVIGVLINEAFKNVVQNNVISGNQFIGIEIAGATASGNVVQGNVIGTNKAGTAAIPNGADGIFINDAPRNTIGGTTKAAGNLVSGNSQVGIQIFGLGAQKNLIQNNTLGRTVSGAVRTGLLNGDSNDLGLYVNTTPTINTIIDNIGQGLRDSPTGAPFIPRDPGSTQGTTTEVRRPGEHARPFSHRPFLQARSRPAAKAMQARKDGTHRVIAAELRGHGSRPDGSSGRI